MFALSQFSGIKGDGEADDTNAFLDACAKMPNGALCEWDVRMRWTDTVVLSNRARLRFWNAHDPRDVTPQEMEYGAFYDGPAGHDMFVRERCRRVSLEGITLAGVRNNEQEGGAGRILYDDQRDGTGNEISSRATLTRVVLWMGLRNDGDAYANALQSVGNCEYPTFSQVMIVGGGGLAGLVRWANVSIEKGAAMATAATPTFRPDDTKERLVIANEMGRFETRIVAVLSETQATLADGAPFPFDHASATISESYGTGIHNGPSFNAKRLQLDDVEVYGCRYGIHSEGGSMQLFRPNFNNNECDVFVEGQQGEPSWEIGAQSERSRQHMKNLSGLPFPIWGSRLDPHGVGPGLPFIDGGSIGGGAMAFEWSSIDESAMPAGSQAFGLSRASRLLLSRGSAYPSRWTRADAGWDASQLKPGGMILSEGDSMQGGAAQTRPIEAIGSETPNARMRQSGRAGWIRGLAMNPVRADELEPGEITEQSIVYGAKNSAQLKTVIRDFKGQVWTHYATLGHGNEKE